METQNSFHDITVRLNRIEQCLYAIMQLQKSAIETSTLDLPDSCSFVQALEFLNERGYTISKSSLYKLTASNGIPHRRFKSRLVFSRKELLAWVEAQTVETAARSEAILQLARSANRKGGAR